MAYRIVIIGSSWGGLRAMSALLDGLPADFPLPVVLVQHRSRESDGGLATLLQAHTSLPVTDVEDKTPLEGGRVYLAPADYHLLVESDHFSLTTDPLVRYSRPSIDVTMMSAADSCTAGVIGVVLTGANQDGALGLRRIVDLGGYAIIQDPATAESRSMPASALISVPKARVLPLDRIAEHLGFLAPPVRDPVPGHRT